MGRFLRITQPAERNALPQSERAIPFLSADALILPLGETARPLPGTHQPDEDGVHPDIRGEFGRKAFQQVLYTRPGGRVQTMCGSG